MIIVMMMMSNNCNDYYKNSYGNDDLSNGNGFDNIDKNY